MIKSLVLIRPPEWPHVVRKYTGYMKKVKALTGNKFANTYISMVKQGHRNNPELKKIIDQVLSEY